MNIQQSYNLWSQQYDTNQNKTRDLEALAIRETLAEINVENCLEIGCGTGKNTALLLTKAKKVVAVDLSEEMLAHAKQKIKSEQVEFIHADIRDEWSFAKGQYDIVSFSLVLEHIENLVEIFKKTSRVVKPNGFVYVGELHPFKQYAGTKARFETEEGLQVVTCYDHNISDFTIAAKQNGFTLLEVNEYFDDNDRTQIPRIITFLFRKD
jgi:ubiquinone/menaquinone biosynthesis C-methylase UbiE